MIQSLARKLDGEPWSAVTPHVKKFMPYTNTYLLDDGSVVKPVGVERADHTFERRVKHHDDGIRIHVQNLSTKK